MTKKALLVGINYNNTDAQLNGCINDVKSIGALLRDNCDYPSENIVFLTEETKELPNRANIEARIKWLVSNCLPGDTLVFYYSGHGASINDTNSDETDGKDEVLVPLDYKTNGVITDDWLFTNMVAKVPTGVTLWAFTDCCHSGTMVDLKFNFKSLCGLKNNGKIIKGMKYNSDEWNDKFSLSMERSRDVQGNTYLFSGCQDQETSADAFIAKKSQGAFSFCLMECLKTNLVQMQNGKTRFLPGKLKLRNLLKEINCRLDINEFGGQNSQLSMSKQSDFERTLDL